MMAELVFILVGALGGLVRGMVGMLKSLGRGEKIDFIYLIITVVIAAIIGAGLGYGFRGDHRASALAGYVGTDILENVFKASTGRNIVLKKI